MSADARASRPPSSVGTPPCATSPDLWFSPVSADRDLAKRICGTCLQRAGCAEAGRGEVWGVWGSVDMEQREAARLTAEMAAGVLEVAEVHRPSRGCYVRGCDRAECRAENSRWMGEYRSRDRVVTAVGTMNESMQLTLEEVAG